MYSKAAEYVRETRNPDHIDMDELDPAAFAIQFYDRIYCEVDLDGRIEPMESGQLVDTVSPLVYMKGELLNINQLVDTHPEQSVKIVPQMQQFDCSHVVKVHGKFKPFFNDRDIFWKPQYKELYYERYPIARS